MKKLFLFVTLLLFSANSFAEVSSAREKCITETSSSPYTLSLPVDISVGVLSLGAFTAGSLMQKLVPLPAVSELDLNPSNVNALDAYFIQPYSKPLDFTGDLLLYTNFSLPVLLFGSQWLLQNFPSKEVLTVTLMYAESFSLSWGIKNIMKVSMHRVRPYMYTSVWDEKAVTKGYDYEYSWPSGHSTGVFMAATFASTVFCQYYPESVWRIPVIAASYTIAAGTAALRMASGNHFFTDVLTGALLGSACGFLVPFVHQVLPKKNTSLSVVPGAVNVHIAL